MISSSLFASLTAKIAGAAIAATAATGGFAAAGALPAPAQQAVANVAAALGVTIPSPHHGAPSAEHASVTGTTEDADDVTPTVHDDVTGTAVDDVTGTATDSNHGHCVSLAAHEAESLGFKGSLKGQFVSQVAQDATAVSAKVEDDAKPDATCQASIDKAKAALANATQKGKGDHGKPGSDDGTGSTPTSTVSPVSGTVSSLQSGDSGEDSHDSSGGSHSHEGSAPGHK